MKSLKIKNQNYPDFIEDSRQSRSNVKFKILYFHLSFSILIFAFYTFAPSAHAALIIQAPKYIGLTNGLVGFWSFDGKDMAGVTAYDRSGNANNGTLTNGPTRAIGKIGQGLNFDSTNDYVNIANESNFDFERTQPFSVSAWVFPNQLKDQEIISKLRSSAGFDGWEVQMLNTSGTIRLWLINNYGTANRIHADCSQNLSANTWTHIAIVYDGSSLSSGIYCYLNAVNVGANPSATTLSASILNELPVQIGTRDSDTANVWGGLIDDVRVYNRALSADEIKRLYRIGATLKINTSINNDSLANGLVGYWSMNGPDVAGTTAYDRSGNAKNGSILGQDISRTGLVGWWKLDEGSGTSAGDSSGQGNTGTLTNGPTWVAGKIEPYAVNLVDTSSHYITMGDPASGALDFGTNSFSFGAWFKGATVGGESFVAKRDLSQSTNAGYDVHTADLAGDIRGRINDGLGNNYTSTWSGTNDGNWHHAMVVVDRSANTFKIYGDGVQRGSNISIAGLGSVSNAVAFRIGSGSNDASFYSGQVDDVRVYNRALSATEIAQLYNYGLPKFAPTAGKIGQGIDSTQSYVNPGNVSSSVNSFSFWMKTASSSPTVNLLDLNAGQSIKIVAGTVTASGLTSPSIFVDGVSGSTVNAGWHHIAVTTGTAVNASAVNLGLNATTTAPLDGVLDDVRFYNRVINNNEIKRLYRIGATLKINTDVSRDNPDLNNGLVGYWSFDGKDMAGNTAYDRSGNNNNGTLTNGPTRAIGKIGQGLNFDGSDDYVSSPHSSSIDFDVNQDFTIAVWVKTTQVAVVDTWPFILSKHTWSAPGRQGYNLLLHNSTSLPWEFEIYSADVGYNVVGASNVADGQWHFLVTGRSGSNLFAYQDGIFSNTAAASSVTVAQSRNLIFGNEQDLSNWAEYNGLIDDVRIYNRVLSGDEIKRLYNLGR